MLSLISNFIAIRHGFDSSQITIKRIARNKNKHVTAVHGLEQFGKRIFIFRMMHLSAFDPTCLAKDACSFGFGSHLTHSRH